MKTIRSFISVPLSPIIASGAGKLIKKFKPLDDSIKWVPVDNFHLTLKFLGEVDNTEVHSVCMRLRNVVSDYDPFELSFGGPGAMPSLQRPRVIIVEVDDPTGNLVQMVSEIEAEMADMGFKPEPRDYRPHLTLGRVRGKSSRGSSELIDAIGQLNETTLGEMVVDELQLMASFLDKGGPTYQVMDTIEFE